MTLGVSIIICCHNSIKRITPTLTSLKELIIPENISIELLFVDNASTDNTENFLLANQNFSKKYFVKIISESVLGLSKARNKGIKESTGDLIIFIDDDVQPQRNWLFNLVDIYIGKEAKAIAGKVIIPNYLQRPWMTEIHRMKLASTENIDPINPTEMIGANMAFSRSVLEKIPMFDEELGSGALGFGEDSLFSMQIIAAGYKIEYAEEAIVEHHFEISRLTRNKWIQSSKLRGKSQAYITHHWEHLSINLLLLKYLKNSFLLMILRIINFKKIFQIEGIPGFELELVKKIYFLKGLFMIKHTPRYYELRGLIKKVSPIQKTE